MRAMKSGGTGEVFTLRQVNIEAVRSNLAGFGKQADEHILNSLFLLPSQM